MKLLKLLFATTNQNKVNRLRVLLDGVEFVTLDSYDQVPEAPETLTDSFMIGAEKALYYYDALKPKYPLLTQDEEIKLVGVSENDQIGNSIKEPVEKKFGSFSDELAIRYYTELAAKYGGSIDVEFRYGHSLIFPINNKNGRRQLAAIVSSSVMHAKLLDRAKSVGKFPDYFLAALITCRVDGKPKHYSDLTVEELIKVDGDLKLSINSLVETYKQLGLAKGH